MNKYEGFIGKVLDGRYKILELVGLGGMACVLKAQDLVMNRIVAIKILNDEYNGNEAAEARFIDESKAVAMLSNKNIVGVYDVAIYPDIKYIVMEYLDGITMREYLDNKGAIGWKEACIYILQILRALEHAHSKGIIHRDIKPQNVMLMKNGDIKVTDFGIAKLPDSAAEQDERAVGTVYYISPEQACGKQTDYYSDIYSVGIMFYEAVTGTLPFTAETPMEIAMMQVNDEPVHPRDIVLDIPVGVSQIILKAMEKSPDERFRSAHAMAKAIEWVLRYPDVIFSMSASAADENVTGKSGVVSIDMISTAELEPYGDEEIAESLGATKKTGAGVDSAQKKSAPKRKAKRSTSMFPIVLAISLAFFIAFISVGIKVIVAVSENAKNADKGATISYPDIVGRMYNEMLYNELSNAKYKFDIFSEDTLIIEEFHADIPNGQILNTEPKGGEKRKVESDKVISIFDKIVVNRHDSVTIPDIIGLSKSTAEVKLKALGLKVEVVEAKNVDKPYNLLQVVSVYPECGKSIKIGETVTIEYYNPAPNSTAKMPNLVGLSAEDAISAGSAAGFKVDVLEVPTMGGNNKVVEQSIPVGTKSNIDETVIITVAVAPKTFVMPDLTGKTTAEVKQILAELCPETEINISYTYYSVDSEQLTYIQQESIFFTNFDQYIELLKEYSNTINAAHLMTSDDGKAVVMYQSVTPNTEVNKEEYGTIGNAAVKSQLRLLLISPYENPSTDPIVPDVSDDPFNPGDPDSSEGDDTSSEENSSESSDESGADTQL